jgi:RNA polymerase sigma factor (sigma-70 family)
MNPIPVSSVRLDHVERLYRDHGAAVRRWAMLFSRSATDAEDIVQEVFLVVHRHRAELAGLRHPAAWLFRIVQNVARRLWRRRRRCRAVNPEMLDDLPDASPTPFDVLAERRLRAQLEQALATLCERDRRLLLLADRRPAPDLVRVWRHRARLRVARYLNSVDAAVIVRPRQRALSSLR